MQYPSALDVSSTFPPTAWSDAGVLLEPGLGSAVADVHAARPTATIMAATTYQSEFVFISSSPSDGYRCQLRRVSETIPTPGTFRVNVLPLQLMSQVVEKFQPL